MFTVRETVDVDCTQFHADIRGNSSASGLFDVPDKIFMLATPLPVPISLALHHLPPADMVA